MSKSLTVRDVPEDVAAELAARAASTGRSLQEFLRAELIRVAEKPDAESWVAGVRARKATTGSTMSPGRILRHRDAGRR